MPNTIQTAELAGGADDIDQETVRTYCLDCEPDGDAVGLFPADLELEAGPAKAGGAPAKKTVPVTIGSRTVQALPNQRLKDVVRAARAPIKFNCENGQCGTCENRVDGRLARICTMSVPARGCKITRK